MATIQKVKNKCGITYRVLIRKVGHKTITKTFPNKSLALKFASDIELNHSLRASHQIKAVTFKELAFKYLQEGYQGTRPKQQKTMTLFWVSHLSDIKATDVTTHQISQILESLKPHYSNSTLNRYKAVISAIYSFSQKQIFVLENPARQVSSYKENNHRTRFLSDAERSRLMTACKASKWHKLHLLVLLAITTGARRSELLNLTWRDIDLSRQVAYLHTSKNKEPRVLPLTNTLTKELSKLSKQHELLFYSPSKPHKPFDFTKHWNQALIAADIKDFRFHDLRHTCASYLAQGGASLLEIADVLGHKQIQITKRYAHLCVFHKRRLIEKHLGDIES